MELTTLVDKLMNPALYPHNPAEVEVVQTQMSIIFLTGEYAYKIKKPVDLGYLDYTSLDKRCHFCHQEVKLNNRLSSGVYIQVVPINEQNGRISYGGKGNTVEYAVKMRQLPSDRMMNVLLTQNRVSETMLRQVARRLANFHKQADTNDEISSYGSLEAIRVNTDENFSQTQRYIGRSLSEQQYQEIANYTNRFIDEEHPCFEKRVLQGRIRDCHGDLHSAHVCFIDGVCIYDCIEFNDRFRYSDVASEIAFLAMDLDFHRHPDLSSSFVSSYVGLSGDQDLLRVLNFYKCYRAYVRGKVESFKLDDPMISQDDKGQTISAASRYFELAEWYTRTP